ncbi:hypothetical protein C2R22_05825 [Salinigranum rubrum]|uniref:Uncharacterized protein n=1 Tax=Salinigranum rubrum TaxID=755307 RepID=A0A2I8VH25_9EURY|nr:hypothetical protein [Salinigranum rubrum]AUV81236.1 hypothetical protein C2R22_05825 [Salinigranum rubrum]
MTNDKTRISTTSDDDQRDENNYGVIRTQANADSTDHREPMTDDTTPGTLRTKPEIVDDEKYIHVEATRATDSGTRIEHRTAEASHIGAEVGVILLGWRDDGEPIINLTGAEWVD